MHHTKMNSSDFSGVVVNQSDRPRGKFTLNGKFFTNLSLYRILERLHFDRKKRVIFVINVTTNANRSFGNQTLLTGFLATNIMQDAFPISNHHIRDNLFEGWVRFGLGTSHKTIVFGVEDRLQIQIHI